MADEHHAFASSGEDAIARALDVRADTTADELPLSQFDEYYEIARTADGIINGDYRRIALQFPDELLHDSVSIYRRLKAKHVDADAMVHYGHACLTQNSRLPVIYVFGQKPFDVSACVASVLDFFTQYMEDLRREEDTRKPSVLVLKHDVGYTHAAETLYQDLQRALKPLGTEVLYQRIAISTLPASASKTLSPSTETSSANGLPEAHSQTHPKTPFDPSPEGIHVESESSNPFLLYIGGESLTLTNLLMTHGLTHVFAYEPATHITRLASSQSNRLLMRRYAAVQRARDADVFGILVGTLGVASYLPLIRHLRELLARHRKKSYTISVGKLNPSKLANFLEIECFVLVACPENSVIEAKEFLRPIVTPFELEVALGAAPSWTGRYVLDFDRLLAEAPKLDADGKTKSTAESRETGAGGEDEDTDEDDDPDRPMFSLVTGTYRHAKRYGAGGDTRAVESVAGSGSEVVLRNQDNAVATLADSAAGMFLQTRSYRGLETRVGEDAPSVLEQGRSGVARGYRDVDHRPPVSEAGEQS
ncbi:putative required for the first step in the synthesis of diphthamide, a post-translational modification of histidine which occurs in translation elongation factor 2 [Lyophyllum shimeji]|uniref:2-(3-amino-3-carboxypropyl)histidine synthase subunit 2 n=1 Tax=Lyophyllum shimeji TaxID=47721 RepID=A0A9P3PWX6_LYOSH|nr:putative required for the first step in the synthesis of diphthamide, a post-translational modification of histidine which occurs in translation elongation factor 2 [Lyophyllum shimeji]